MAGARIETDKLGIPLLFAASVNLDLRNDLLTGFRWADSAWTQTWSADHEPGLIGSVLAPRGEQYLLWLDYAAVPSRPGPYRYLFMARVGAGVGPVDSVAVLDDMTTHYAGAVGSRRRWVVAVENGWARLFYSDTVGAAWRELMINAYARNGVAITVLDDSTSMVAFAGSGDVLNWGIARGQTWTRGLPGLPDPRAWEPFFRPRPSGGQWLGWAAFDLDARAGIASYRDGTWSAPETLRCLYRTPGQHYSSSIELSRDEGEYPAVAWSSDVGVESFVCACMPSDSVYGLAEELEGSYTDGRPTVTRDANGDVWVAWWAYYRGMSWVHTYARAVTSAPRVTAAGGQRALVWSLSEPALGSWWTVQRSGGQLPRRDAGRGLPRARDDEEFEDLARVRAGDDTEMSWTDRSPPGGVLRYRIRRDCVDKRYEWLSDEVTWPPQIIKPRAMRLTARGAALGTELELDGVAPGSFEVGVYDVQGRLVLRQTGVAETDVPRTFHVDLGTRVSRFPAGIYFIRVRDALDRESNAVKTVLLK